MRIILPSINCMVDFANYANPNPTLANQVPSVPTAGPCPTATIAPPDFGLPPPGTVGPNPNDALLNGVPIVFWGAPVGSGPIVPGSLPPPIPTTWQHAYVDPQDFYVHLNHQYFGLFFQDQWRISPKLTFNYGLRWDVETGLSQIINPDYRGWQPRIGFAWSPAKHTVVRTGFGIFDDHYNMTFLFVTYPQREVVIPNAIDPGVRQGNDTATWVLNQLYLTGALFGLKYPNGAPAPFPAAAAKELVLTGQTPANFNTGPPGSFVTNSGGGIDPNSRIAYSEQASVQVDQELKKGLVLSVGYLFLRARKQFRPLDLNVCPSAGEVNAATFCPAASAVNPAFVNNQLPDGKAAFSGPLYSNAGLMYYVDATGNAYYNGGTFNISDRFGTYFRFAANYTLSHTQDDGTFLTFVSTPEDLYERKLERGDSVQDVRNRFVGNFTADTPNHGWARNFEFSGIVTLQSARPFTLFVGNDVNGDTNPVTDRVGWSPRNAYRGDPFYAVDLRLARLIHLSERMGLNLSLDAFDVFNRQNINEVTSVYGGGTPDFCGGATFDTGPIPKHYNDAASLAIQQGKVACLPVPGISTAPAPNPLFGTPRTMFNPRQLQASAKFTF